MNFLLEIDKSILFWIQSNLRSDFLDSFFKAITFLTDKGLIWIAIGLALLVIKKTRSCGIYFSLSLLTTSIFVNLILKPIFNRLRPCDIINIEMIIQRPHGSSFPSGHTACAFAVATILFLFNKKYGLVAFLFAFITGFSRIYFFVHYPSDVLGGMLIGALTSVLVFKGLNFLTGENEKGEK